MKRNLSIMIKPSSSMCNMDCAYCFYRSIAENRKDFSHGYMTKGALDTVIRSAFEYTDGGTLAITFQGGEPLLSGKEFFRSVNRAIGEYNVYNGSVMLSVQTNGTLIDEEWCEILKDYLVGISLDSGIKEFNALRVESGGDATVYSVVKNIKLLSERGIEFNVLSVVTKDIADNIDEVFCDFADRGIRYLQFIPCLKPYVINGDEREIYLSGEEYGEFLIKLFRSYYRYFMSGEYVSVRLFDNIVRLAAGREPEQCGMSGRCSKQFVIGSDGDVYPCDFYCSDDRRIGNICESSFEELEDSEAFKSFLKESLDISLKCAQCDIFRYCRGGGCKRERRDMDTCAAYKMFFEECLPDIMTLVPYC